MKQLAFFRTRVLIITLTCSSLFSQTAQWTTESVDWRLGEHSRIKAVRYPVSQQRPRLSQLDPPAETSLAPLSQSDVLVNDIIIDSPPMAGFTPWVAFAATNQRKPELEMDTEISPTVLGSYMIANPQLNYGIALLDTGAAAHVINYENAARLGIQGTFVTTNTMQVEGVTGSVSMQVSEPLALYAAGFYAIEPNGVLDLDTLLGQYNVSIGVGYSTTPNLPTALGIPLAVYYTVVFYNDTYFTINRYGTTYTAPDIRLYLPEDNQIPEYNILLPLELRPLGAQSVQYTPDYDSILGGGDVAPATPSIVIGLGSQSLYFVHSVDLYENTRSAIDRNRFMLDTGAQVSVIGQRVGARLGLDPANPDFQVDIEGVNGQTAVMDGFYIDRLEIPALGQ